MKLNHRNGVSKAVLTALVITATSGSVCGPPTTMKAICKI